MLHDRYEKRNSFKNIKDISKGQLTHFILNPRSLYYSHNVELCIWKLFKFRETRGLNIN